MKEQHWLSRLRGPAYAVALSTMALCCSACATTQHAQSSKLPEPQAPTATEDGQVLPVNYARELELDEQVPTAPAGAARIQRARTMSSDVDQGIQLVAYQETALPAPGCPPEAITSCPPEARQPVAGANPYGVGMPHCDVACQPSPAHYPDEYLCDGGDRELPVHYGADVRLGLDTEDTVAEYTKNDGSEGLTKSNKVCVYAPRFASVRSVSLPHQEGTYREVGGIDHAGLGGEMQNQLVASLGQRNIAADGVRMRSRASGLETEQISTDMQQRQRPQLQDKVLNTFQDVGFFRSGLLDQSDVARLNLGIGAALVWTRELYPVIQGKVERATTGLSEVQATALTIVKVDDKPGSLRIVKVADKQSAEPGDIITFSIRYDNPGPTAVSSVRIIDNLTPRLEYVIDSATCEVAGRLVVQDNGEGSLVLIWELDEPVAPKTGGVVTFQAKVR
ncbi:hypothetical protein GC163_05395 [bacterium]|nr:hypothetical protein [bacterium]